MSVKDTYVLNILKLCRKKNFHFLYDEPGGWLPRYEGPRYESVPLPPDNHCSIEVSG